MGYRRIRCRSWVVAYEDTLTLLPTEICNCSGTKHRENDACIVVLARERAERSSAFPGLVPGDRKRARTNSVAVIDLEPGRRRVSS